MDCDGTMYMQPDDKFTNLPFWHDIIDRSADVMRKVKPGIVDPRAEVNRIFTQYKGEVSEGFVAEGFCESKEEYFRKTWGRVNTKKYMIEGRLLPGTLDKLVEKDFGLAILSNAPRVWIDHALEELGVARYFWGRVWTGESTERKPTPASFLQVLNQLGIDANDAVMIGDDPTIDILPSNALGIKTIQVNPHNKESVATYSVRNINDIRRILC